MISTEGPEGEPRAAGSSAPGDEIFPAPVAPSFTTPPVPIKSDRWLRIIPVALIMYTISYVDRTNISLALDRNMSSMMKDLFMDDKMKGEAGGIFFFGYVLLQIPGGYLAGHWSAKKLIS